MADQTQRLEIATVRAEVGSNIVFRFANDAANADSIPTQSGAIQNLKQVVLEIQQDAAEKISISTTIYPTVAAGLAATADQGIFLVQSNDADEIYTVWQNQGGTAVNTGKTALSATAIQTALDASNEAAQAAEDAAEVATSRTARYLAPSASQPVVRDDGLPLQIGDVWFSTTNQTEYRYTQSGWQPNDSIQAINELKETISYSPSANTIPMADALGKLSDDYLTENILRKTDISSADALKSIGFQLDALGSAIRTAYDRITESISLKDFGEESEFAINCSPAFKRALAHARFLIDSSRKGLKIIVPSGDFVFQDLVTQEIVGPSSPDQGHVYLIIEGAGNAATNLIAAPGNSGGMIKIVSNKNVEIVEFHNLGLLSDLNQDAATNNGTALEVSTPITPGSANGDSARCTVKFKNIWLGGYGKTPGEVARRGNWKRGIAIFNQWYPAFEDCRLLTRYDNNIGARTASEAAIYQSGCYSPEFRNVYVHGGWKAGILCEGVLDSSEDIEDFRMINCSIVGPLDGFLYHHKYSTTDKNRLYEPGGYFGGVHIACGRFGVHLKNHRQVIHDGLYIYSKPEIYAEGEKLPAGILLENCADILIDAEFLEPGFYTSNTNAWVAVRVEGASEAIHASGLYGAGGIGLLNNSTYTDRKSIVWDPKLTTSRRTSAWAQFVPFVDNAGTLTTRMINLGAQQDKFIFGTGKAFPASHPIALRTESRAANQVKLGAIEMAGRNSAGDIKDAVIIQGSFADSAAGAEQAMLQFYLQRAGGISELIRILASTTDGESPLQLLFRLGGNYTLRTIKAGPAGSGPGGSGRALYIDN